MSETNASKRFTINAAFFQEIKDDHIQLHELLGKLRNLVAQRPALTNHAKEFVDQLFELCDQLALHFTLEEAYGYIEDFVKSAPHLHSRTERLREQHTKLFVMARDLADGAASKQGGDAAGMMEIADHFIEFDDALKIHEDAERQLILTAMNQDVGVGD